MEKFHVIDNSNSLCSSLFLRNFIDQTAANIDTQYRPIPNAIRSTNFKVGESFLDSARLLATSMKLARSQKRRGADQKNLKTFFWFRSRYQGWVQRIRVVVPWSLFDRFTYFSLQIVAASDFSYGSFFFLSSKFVCLRYDRFTCKLLLFGVARDRFIFNFWSLDVPTGFLCNIKR